MSIKSFDTILNDYTPYFQKTSKQKKTISKENIIYSNELVRDIKEIIQHTSLESCIARFEKYNYRIDRIEYQTMMQNRFFNIVSVEYYYNPSDRMKKTAEMIIFIGKAILKLINAGIAFIIDIIQFIINQIIKALAKKVIPKEEFETKISRLKEMGKRKTIKTKYPMEVSQNILVGVKKFLEFMIPSEDKIKKTLAQYKVMTSNLYLDFKKINLENFSYYIQDNMDAHSKVFREAGMSMWEGLKKLDSDYKKIIKTTKQSDYVSFVNNLQEGASKNTNQPKYAETWSNNPIMMLAFTSDSSTFNKLGKDISDKIFGKDGNINEFSSYEFFMNNAKLITTDGDNFLDFFITNCKKIIKIMKDMSTDIKQTLHSNGGEKDEKNILKLMFQSFLLKTYINPLIKCSILIVNNTLKHFTINFYHLKLHLLNLWKHAIFSKNGEVEILNESNDDIILNNDIPLGLPPAE